MVTTPDGPGQVMGVNLLTEVVTVSFDQGDERVSKTFKASDLC